MNKILFIFFAAAIVFFWNTDFFHKAIVSKKYGLSFNSERRKIGLDTLPSDWFCNKTSQDFFLWYPEQQINEQVFIGKEIKVNGMSIIMEKNSYQFRDSIWHRLVISYDFINHKFVSEYFDVVEKDYKNFKPINVVAADSILLSWKHKLKK